MGCSSVCHNGGYFDYTNHSSVLLACDRDDSPSPTCPGYRPPHELRLTVAVYPELCVSVFLATQQPKTDAGAADYGNKPINCFNLLTLCQRGPQKTKFYSEHQYDQRRYPQTSVQVILSVTDVIPNAAC